MSNVRSLLLKNYDNAQLRTGGEDKDVRTLVADEIAAVVAFLDGSTPPETHTYNNGVFDVPAKPSVVISVDQDNVQAEIIDSG